VRAHLARLEQRDQALRSFLANTTHDVMVPLTVLQGHLASLREAAAAGRAPEPGLWVAALQEAHYMASLLHNLGAAAKLEAAESLVLSHPVLLGELVERVVARHRPVAEPAGVELVYFVPERPLETLADVTLIEQALSNLVHNAVRYNRRGGHVAVVLEEVDGRFALRVLDDGPGVGNAELERLRERAYRTDEARARHPDGLGLGLSIASDVAQHHGFELELATPAAGGLQVTLRGPTLGPA
jgi:signal transduction histidine kinase